MSQISTRLSDDLVASLDAAAARLHSTRAEVVRQAVEYYLDDLEEATQAVEALRDPTDPVLDWETVKRGLLDQQEGDGCAGLPPSHTSN